ncbi:MAG: S8 family serine peptidase, partial [Woeseia sp.]
MNYWTPLKLYVLGAALAVAAGLFVQQHVSEPEVRTSYIVQGQDFQAVLAAVSELDGEVTHELSVIRAVAVNLTEKQANRLRKHAAISRLFGNASVEVSGKPDKGGSSGSDGSSGDNGGYAVETFYPTLVGANQLHQQGIDGWAIGIATIDTGLWSHKGLITDRYGMLRRKVAYDAITNTVTTYRDMSGSDVYDKSGHGSHVASIAASSVEVNGSYNGIAPGARLIPVTALDENGQGTYADVIRAIDWLIANRNKHGIDIINMSLSAPARSHYW